MSKELLESFALLAASEGGIAKLRELILSLAVRGQLVRQDPADEPASELLKRIRAEKERLVSEGKIKQEKALPAIGEEEKPFELPAGWEWVRFGEVWKDSFYGPRFSNGEYVISGGIPTIRTTDMSDGRIVLNDAPLVAVPEQKLEDYLVRKGDLLVTRSGSIGVMALFDLDLQAIPSAYLIRLRFASNVFPDFFYWYLRSPLGQDQLGLGTTSVGVPNISASKMSLFLTPTPPLSEQSRIVAKVEALMALCDRLEAQQGDAAWVQTRWTQAALDQLAASGDADEFARNWQTLAEHFDTLFATPSSIDALDATLLQLAVRGKLVRQNANARLPSFSDAKPPRSLPKSWGWSRFGDLIEDLRYGTSQKCSYETRGVPVLRIPNLVNETVSCSDLKYGPLSEEELNRLRLRSGDLLMIRSNGSASLVGRAALVGPEAKDFAFAGYLVRIRIHTDQMSARFALLTLGTNSVREQIEGPIRTTSGVKNINSTEIRNLFLPIPPLSEQSRIVAKLDELLALTRTLRTRLTDARAVQGRLASALVDEVAAC